MDNNLFSLTPQAEQDIRDIWLYIAQDNVSAAEAVADDLEKAFLKLSQTPNIGTKRTELLKEPVRFWVVHSYYIIYNPDTHPMQIIRIISSYRDVQNCY